MASFLRSFATGFVSAANVQFDEKRKAQVAKDLEYAKLATKTFASLSATKSTATQAKKDLASSRAVLTPQIAGAVPGANLAAAMVFNNMLDPKQVPNFLQNIPSEMKARLAADPFTFTPGQTGIADITTALKNAGIPDKNIQEFIKGGEIDVSQFAGQPEIPTSFTGGPEDFNITDAIPSQQEQRVKALATTFIGKANMFQSNKDFQTAIRAHARGDFETVLDLTARSPNIQNNIFLPILEKILASGMPSLTENERVLLDLYRPRDPLTQMMNLMMLQNEEFFKSLIQDGIDGNTITEPPPSDADAQTLLEWWEQNIGPMFDLAGRKWDEIIELFEGREQ